MEEFRRLREDDAAALSQSDRTGAVTVECRDDISRCIVKPLQGLAVDLDGVPGASAKPPEECSRRIRRRG